MDFARSRFGSETRGVWLGLFAVVCGALGLVLAVGGAWLAMLGGSPYYVLAGLGLLACAALAWGRRRALAAVFVLVFLGTLAWTVYESGLDYWRWVPRFGLMLALAFWLALLLPRLGVLSRRGAGWLAGSIAVVFAIAFGLAFVPHGVTRSDRPVAERVAPLRGDNGVDWPVYGRTQAATRYSPLTAIGPGNVSRLRRAWTFRTGDLPGKRWGAETTPLKVGARVYLCSGRNRLFALDARTGQRLWEFDPGVKDEWIPYTAACRGVTYYRVPGVAADAACAERIIEGTLDARLIAVDARDGRPCAGFGRNGQVDVRVGLGKVAPGMVSMTSTPVLVRGVLVTGHQVLDGQRRWAPSGVIRGFDAVTGELRWAWDMAQPDRHGLPPPGETYTRGTPNMWTTATADEALGLVYVPLGVSAADYWSSSRGPLEDRYATSLVALDVATGRPAWHFQTVHIDVWDYDLGSQASLVDLPSGSGTVPALVLPSKQGDIYVLDRRNGRPLTGVEERPVPGGGLEPRRRSPTQPFSTWHTLRKRNLTARDMWGISPVDQMICRIQFRRAAYKGIYTPPEAGRHYIQYPGYNGGSDWGSVAIDPQRGILVANYNDMPNYNILVPRGKADRLGWAPREEVRGDMGGAEGAGDPQVGTPFAIKVNAGWRLPVTKLLCKQPPYGGLRAIDLRTGKTLWDRPFGTARRNGPFGLPSGLPIDIGTPNNGGAALSASGLIFIAAATDDLIRAVDIRTGETLWSDVLPAGGQATPILYSAGGREYLVIVAAGHHFMETPEGDYVIAYALP